MSGMLALQINGTPVRGIDLVETINLIAGDGVSISKNYAQPARRLDLTVTALGGGAFICGARAAVTSGSYLRTINGVVMSATIGFYCPWDIVVTAIAYAKSDSIDGTLELRDDGVTVETLVTGSAAAGAVTDLEVEIAAGSVMAVSWTSSGGSITDGVVHVFWRRAS